MIAKDYKRQIYINKTKEKRKPVYRISINKRKKNDGSKKSSFGKYHNCCRQEPTITIKKKKKESSTNVKNSRQVYNRK